jgi:hypothetical protein
MARDKQIGLKFQAEDIARWDAWAKQHELTRTTMIEAAMSLLMGVDVIAEGPLLAHAARTSTAISVETGSARADPPLRRPASSTQAKAGVLPISRR